MINLNSDNVEKICDEVYVIHNFLSSEEIAGVFEELNLVDWNSTYHARGLTSLRQYEDRFKKILNDDSLHFDPIDNVIKRFPSQGMDPHVDRKNYQNPLYSIIVDDSFTGDKIETGLCWYAFILYLNDDFTGGEICYPEYGIEYKPKAGDIVIHKSSVVHAVKKVKEGFRYTHSSTVYKSVYLNKEIFYQLPKPYSKEYQGVLLNYSYTHAKDSGEPSWNHRLRKFLENYKDEGIY